MKDGRLVIAFDVDDTLLVPNIATDKIIRSLNEIGYLDDYIEPAGYAHNQNINSYKWYQSQGCYMIIWSGTGEFWARKWADYFELEPNEIREKRKYDDIDISVDDCIVDLAKVNIRIKRVNNSISRKEWNKIKHK